MSWESVKNLGEEEFKRYTGVTRKVFKVILEVLTAASSSNKRGRPSLFCLEDQILITLEYLREYRTFFHIGVNWKAHESTINRIVRRVEDILIKDKRFHLPGKKALLSANSFNVIVVDATESPIERPQKDKNAAIVARKSATP